MTERDKIANVLNSTEISQELSKEDIYKFADALIAAAIGGVKEAEHRAEVAERGFNNTIKVFHDMLSAIFPSIKIDLDEWKKDNLAISEKELAEENK